MATRWGLRNLDRFAGIAAHGGVRLPELPKRPRPIPVFLSAGAEDEEWAPEVAAAEAALRAAGFEAGSASWPGLGHEDADPGVWTRAFDFLEGALSDTRRRLARAERARREKRWADALAEARAVLAVEKERARVLDAEREARLADQAGVDLVKKARDAARTDPAGARARLRDLEAAFRGGEAGARAAEALRGLEGEEAPR